MFELPQCQRYLIFYGKGGIGKTTAAINLAYALNELGEKVAVIGCSPKSSLWDFCGFPDKSTLLDVERSERLSAANINKAVLTTRKGMILVESGGPEPGVGCGGRGLILALESLKKLGPSISGLNEVSYAIYDVIGDVVCGGFAMPMKGGGQRDVYIVTSGELLSLYAANNIASSVAKLAQSGTFDIRAGGYIANMRGISNEREILEKFSEMTGIPILAFLPWDTNTFGQAEKANSPIVNLFPENEIAQSFRKLARKIREDPQRIVPKPVERYEDLFDMFMYYQTRGTEPLSQEIAPTGKEDSPVILRPLTTHTPKKIAIYGTGGIGKSTTSANLGAALARLGEKVYQVGCDPKRDSISTLCGELKPTILDEFRKKGWKQMTPEVIRGLVFEAPGFEGQLYGSECGGPAPGKGCAGYGVDIALEYLEKFHIINDYGFTFIINDVLGDTVCGGFATPLKYVNQVYVVTSGEVPALVQAMKICQSVDVVSKQGLKVDSMGGVIAHQGGVNVGIAGVINNKRGLPDEEAIVEEVFGAIEVPVIHHIPRSKTVQMSENLRMTVVRAFPESDQAREYMELAAKIRENEKIVSLKRNILSKSEIQQIVNKYR